MSFDMEIQLAGLSALPSLAGGFTFVLLDCQPLHVPGPILPATFQRYAVVDLPAWACAFVLACRRTGVCAAKLSYLRLVACFYRQ
jgi:hypothetical protein